MFNGSDVVVKECRPKVTKFDDLLGNIHSREMVATSTNMQILKNWLILLMGEALVKDSIHSILV